MTTNPLNKIDRLPIVRAELVDGPLFEDIIEGEQYFWYRISTRVTLADGRVFQHEFSPYGMQARDQAEAFLARVQAKGTVDLAKGWHEVEAGPSLEDRLGAFGDEWMREAQERFEYTGRYFA